MTFVSYVLKALDMYTVAYRVGAKTCLLILGHVGTCRDINCIHCPQEIQYIHCLPGGRVYRCNAVTMYMQFANGQGLTKYCGSHEMFTTKINNFGKFEINFHENFVPRKFGAIR